MTTSNLETIVTAFQMPGKFVDGAPYGSGHINDTFACRFDRDGQFVRALLQRINDNAFKNPEQLMRNVKRVTEHVRATLEKEGAADIGRRTLTLIPTLDDACFFKDEAGSVWRAYEFIERASTYDQIENADQAFQAARAFGEFQERLADMPGPPLAETIPDFHNTRRRFDALLSAIEADTSNRASQVIDEIRFAKAHESIVDILLNLERDGAISQITCHNDTKLNNVMLDDETHRGICVIDLDTVMPGLSLYDFGDMARSATRPTLEDETDLSKVEVQLDMFEALTRGYLAGASHTLNQVEKDHLVFSAGLITFEIGLRFLTDYLQGDTYFKTSRPDQNLDRCRVQFKMVESFENNEAAMTECVRRLRDGQE